MLVSMVCLQYENALFDSLSSGQIYSKPVPRGQPRAVIGGYTDVYFFQKLPKMGFNLNNCIIIKKLQYDIMHISTNIVQQYNLNVPYLTTLKFHEVFSQN